MRPDLSNQTFNLTASKTILHVNLQNIMLMLSAICIAAMFYFSKPHYNTSEETTTVASPSPEIKKPFSGNGIGSGKTTQSVTNVVTDALAFYNSLTSSTDKATLQLTYTSSLARKWSNLPCGTSCRNGLQLGTNLTSAQYLLAMQIIKDALGTAANDGYDEYHQMNLAEAYLHANGGGSGYDSTLRWMAFLNTPSVTGAWMLQFGGHHYAANIAFNNGHVIGATPFFMGLEPKTFTYNSVTYDPLGGERDSLRAALASLSSSQLTTALISSSFSDCVMIPGETNGGPTTFPSYAIGQPLSSLTTAQKTLVLAVIKLYVKDIDSATYNAVIAGYTTELSQAYISYHGSGTSGTGSTFLAAAGDYARISGPNVWIEFSCQNGVVIQGQIHYHTVWRDRSHDYGVDLTGTPIDVSTLPVSLLQFKGVSTGTENILSWTTATEINNKNFELLRSADGINFNSITTVASKAANGNSSLQINYSYEDKQPLNGLNYYKLAQVDKDGRITYSGVVLIKSHTINKIEIASVYPNPAKKNLQIVLALAAPQKIIIAITDAHGKKIKQQNYQASSGNNTVNLNVQGIAAGIYFIKAICENGDESSAQKFVKQ